MKRTDVIVGEHYAVALNKGVGRLGRGWLLEAVAVSVKPEDKYKQYSDSWSRYYDMKPGVRVLLVEKNQEVVLPARSIAGLWSEEQEIQAQRKRQAEARDEARANNEVRTEKVLAALKARGHNLYWYPTYRASYDVSLDVLEDLLGITKGEEV